MYLRKNNFISNRILLINDFGQVLYVKQVLNGQITFYFRYYSAFFYA